MLKSQITAALLFACLICISAEEKNSQPRVDDFLRPPAHQAPTETQSYFSKFSGWLFGGDKSHSPSSAPAHPGPQNAYLPPSKLKECNPCDEVPWIPILSNHGKESAINFVHSSELNKPEYGPPRTHLQPIYGPPANGRINPSGAPPVYGPPAHGLPKIHPSFQPPVNHESYHGPPPDSYQSQPSGAPFNFHTPAPNIGLPLTIPYGPPTPVYGPPLKNHLSNPTPTASYGPPNYKPPPPISSYNKPPSSPSSYNTPLQPHSLHNKFPPPSHKYVRPQPQRHVYPKRPMGRPFYNPSSYFTPPRPFGSSGLAMLPPPPTAITPKKLPQLSPISVTPAPFEFHSPPTNIISTASLPLSTPNVRIPLPGYRGPVVDSYGPPPSGPVTNDDSFFGNPQENFHVPSGGGNIGLNNHPNFEHISKLNFLNPIPFPNMSPHLILPLHEASPFNNFQSENDDHHHETNEGYNSGRDVSISQSIPLSSFDIIENKPEVIQSPLIDIHVPNNGPGNFDDNPIVVDGDIHHQEASSTLVTVHNDTTNNANDILSNSTYSSPLESSLEIVVSKNHISEIIAKERINEINEQAKPFEVVSEQNTNPGSSISQFSVGNNLFTPPTMDYSSWSPSFSDVSLGMSPPPATPDWNDYRSTKNPKQIQIIVPYVPNDKNWQQNQGRKVPPPHQNPSYNAQFLPKTEESQWTKYMQHTERPTVSNIGDLLKDTPIKADHSHHLPFDIVDLQKNIDVWTELEYNNARNGEVDKFTHSKKIPEDFLPTLAYDVTKNEITTVVPFKNSKSYFDYVASGTNQNSVKANAGHSIVARTESPFVVGNHINPETTQKVDTTSKKTPKDHVKTSWEETQVSVSPVTRERVYVVTPLPIRTDSADPRAAWPYVPKNEIHEINRQLAADDTFAFTSPRFAVRPEPLQVNKSEGATENGNDTVHLVYEDWPHLINSWETTTTQAPTSTSSTTRHPLLGSMDLPVDTRSPEATVQTYTGHSKVVTVVSAAGVAKKKSGLEDKKTTPKSVEKL